MGARGIGAAKLTKIRELAETLPALPVPRLDNATSVIRFCESLPVTAGRLSGKFMKMLPWQREAIKAIYSPKRRIRTAFVSLPRKAGKSGFAVALVLAHLVAERDRAQIYSAACSREQSGIIFREVVAIIERTPQLASLFNIRHQIKEIEHLKTGATFRALAADAKGVHGLSPSVVIMDELAQWPNRDLYDALVTAGGARDNPLNVVISTLSPSPVSVMTDLTNYAQKVASGDISDPTFYGLLHSAPTDADPWAEATWKLANPSLGHVTNIEEYRVQAQRAQAMPSAESAFRCYFLNQAVATETAFIHRADWEANNARIDPQTLKGQPCFGGLDLSSTQDLTALVLYFPDSGAVLCHAWVPGESVAVKAKADRVPYDAWVRQGFIETTQGRAIDYRSIAMRLGAICSQYAVQAIAYDRWKIEQLKSQLANEGIPLPLTPWGQGYKDMSPAIDALETAVLSRTLAHGANPVLNWCISNCVITIDPAGLRKLDKSKSIDRIDGAVALAMALGVAARKEIQPEFDAARAVIFL
jgi:phage terminase large subunit-like protein